MSMNISDSKLHKVLIQESLTKIFLHVYHIIKKDFQLQNSLKPMAKLSFKGRPGDGLLKQMNQ